MLLPLILRVTQGLKFEPFFLYYSNHHLQSVYWVFAHSRYLYAFENT